MKDSEANLSTSKKNLFQSFRNFLFFKRNSREQLMKQLHKAEQKRVIDTEALAMMQGVLQVAEMQAQEIMVPRSQMIIVNEDSTPDEFIRLITESAHSRFPVIGDNRDEVVGILLAKDLLDFAFNKEKKIWRMRDYLRPAIFIPESKHLNSLLNEFRSKRYHMAIVVDEYGGISGLVTIEDVLEQIVGDISDEHDIEDEEYIKKRSDNSFIVKALIPIDEFNEYFTTDFEDKLADTIGGIVIKQFGHLPKRGETITIGNYNFHILHADSRRIRSLQVSEVVS